MSKKTFRTVIITAFGVILLLFIIISITPHATLLKVNSVFKKPLKTSLPNKKAVSDDFQIIEVRTGLTPTSTLWFPTVFVKIKNISGRDITEHNELKVVYVDSKTSEIINQDDCDISGSALLFPFGTQKKFALTTSFNLDLNKEKHKWEMKNRKVVAQLYLNDNLVGSHPVNNVTIHFNKF